MGPYIARGNGDSSQYPVGQKRQVGPGEENEDSVDVDVAVLFYSPVLLILTCCNQSFLLTTYRQKKRSTNLYLTESTKTRKMERKRTGLKKPA